MRHHSVPIGLFAIACSVLTHASAARAAAATWVSGTGSNAGSCPITAPCASFQFAHQRTDAGGTINVLSAGSYGPLTITKSISIVADRVEAAIHAGGAIGAAIKIEAGAGDIVSLRGLTLDLRGTNNIGIHFISGAELHLHNSVIRKATKGINFAPASGSSALHIADSVIANTNSVAILVAPTGSAAAKAVLDRVRVEDCSDGIGVSGGDTSGSVTATVRDSVVAGNANGGIHAFETGGGTTIVMVDRSAAVNNGNGIYAQGGGATIRIGDSTVSGNTNVGLLSQFSGTIASYGTNKVNGNFLDGAPTTTITMK